jgi:hypothetical protein
MGFAASNQAPMKDLIPALQVMMLFVQPDP